MTDTPITDAAFPAIARLTNLTRLDLSRTRHRRDLQALARLSHLET